MTINIQTHSIRIFSITELTIMTPDILKFRIKHSA